MNIKPILFSTPMVQAILDGRKTMTRRVIKTTKDGVATASGLLVEPDNDWCAGKLIKPKYQTGDILWVRETWARREYSENRFYYKATPELGWVNIQDGNWRPSIFMPKAAARIFLKVTNVRIERLREILCGDMKREGCIPATVTGGQYQQWQRDYWIPLWDSINAKRGYGWETNPWVWVISFEQCDKPKGWDT